MPKILTLGACVYGLMAIACGAFAAHALRDKMTPAQLNLLDLAARYQLIHAVALLALQRLGRDELWLMRAGVCWLLGVALFSGSLYLLAATAWRSWGMLTPVGGVLLLLGWGCVGLSAWDNQK